MPIPTTEKSSFCPPCIPRVSRAIHRVCYRHHRASRWRQEEYNNLFVFVKRLSLSPIQSLPQPWINSARATTPVLVASGREKARGVSLPTPTGAGRAWKVMGGGPLVFRPRQRNLWVIETSRGGGVPVLVEH